MLVHELRSVEIEATSINTATDITIGVISTLTYVVIAIKACEKDAETWKVSSETGSQFESEAPYKV